MCAFEGAKFLASSGQKNPGLVLSLRFSFLHCILDTVLILILCPSVFGNALFLAHGDKLDSYAYLINPSSPRHVYIYVLRSKKGRILTKNVNI